MGNKITPSVRTRRRRLSLGLLVLSAALCLQAMGCANGDNAPANPAADAVVPPPDGPVDGPAAIPPVENNTDSGGADDGADPKHVVFVVDRSGSMVTVFDYVRVQMQLSIKQLGEDQQFHIVLFADEKTIEGPGKGLVKGTAENKAVALQFLQKREVQPRGMTTALVAIKRAFQVLESTGDRKDKLILLLTDGELAGIGRGRQHSRPVCLYVCAAFPFHRLHHGSSPFTLKSQSRDSPIRAHDSHLATCPFTFYVCRRSNMLSAKQSSDDISFHPVTSAVSPNVSHPNCNRTEYFPAAVSPLGTACGLPATYRRRLSSSRPRCFAFPFHPSTYAVGGILSRCF